MGTKNEDDHDEAARLDRQYTGDSVNARTDELKEELEQETEQLQRKYVDTGKPETGGKKD
jgi:hypothetical protein